MRKAIIFSLAVLAGCSAETKPLTVADAVEAGFVKQSQKMFQMIGAQDGWSGTWQDEKVELYQYESIELVNGSIFESATQAGNKSGWVDMCQVENMLMLSKGRKACNELNSLTGQ
jgi:hypothetical protein